MINIELNMMTGERQVYRFESVFGKPTDTTNIATFK